MKIAVTIARVLLGLIFFVFGLNGFLQFMPAPELTGDAAKFVGVMASTGYFKVIVVIKIVGGLLLLIGRYVPLGLVLLGPVIVNILLFHIYIEPAGMGMAVLVFALEAFLIWAHRTHCKNIFSAKAEIG